MLGPIEDTYKLRRLVIARKYLKLNDENDRCPEIAS